MIHPLPPGAWQPADGGVAARLALAEGARCVVWTEGWDSAAVALATAGTARFTPLSRSAFAEATAAGGVLVLHAPRAPDRGVAIVTAGAASAHGTAILRDHATATCESGMGALSCTSPGLGAAGSPALAAGWPRSLLARRQAAPRAAAPDAGLVARLLEAGETDMLLALLGEALLGGAARDAILAAARGIFLHRARHPLAPDPGLAALLAALPALDPS